MTQPAPTTETPWKLALTAKSVAKREARRFARSAEARLDFEQEAYLALLHAARKFDASRGVKFSTYAKWWVQAALHDASRTATVLHLPARAHQERRRLRQAVVEAREDGILAPDPAVLAETTGFSVKKVKRLLRDCSVVSTDRPTSEDGSTTLGELLPSARPTPEAEVEVHLEVESMQSAIDTLLTERQRIAIVRRYGLRGHARETYDQIGDALGLSRERARQICAAALRLMRDAGGIRENLAA